MAQVQYKLRLDPSFDYRGWIARRDRIVFAALIVCVGWWGALMVVGLGARWWAPLALFKDIRLWGPWTVDRVLALGALLSALIAIGGPWLLRHVRRPPQLIVLLRDFQSRDAARLAAGYVRRHGSAWGYWITLENADFRAAESLGGEAEMVDDRDRGDAPPVGSWWGTSLVLGLVVTSMLTLAHLDSALLRWMRTTSRAWGGLGELMLGIGLIVSLCLVWFFMAAVIRWAFVTIQRRVFLPRRIDSAERLDQVIGTILRRIQRRASPLTLGPLPVISVADPFWQAAVLRCLDEARLVVFVIAARESEALAWEMAQVRQRIDPARTLAVRVTGAGIALSDGQGRPIPVLSGVDHEEAIDHAVRDLLTTASPNRR